MRILLVALWASVWTGTAAAAIIVDPPQPLTRRVTVQLIQTALDNGSSPATAFGNSTQRADIEASIDSIWAQAGSISRSCRRSTLTTTRSPIRATRAAASGRAVI